MGCAVDGPSGFTNIFTNISAASAICCQSMGPWSWKESQFTSEEFGLKTQGIQVDESLDRQSLRNEAHGLFDTLVLNQRRRLQGPRLEK
jgi:hypothetical protein